MEEIDCLFINPRDLVGADAYIRLANLAGLIRTENYSFDILEPAAQNVTHAQIIRVIRDRAPTIVCLGVLPSTLPDAYQMIQKIRRINPNIAIVVEGYQINADPRAVKELQADYGLIGDPEYTFLHLCKFLINGTSLPKDLMGLVINRGGELEIPLPAFIKHLDELPIPAFDKLPIGRYYSASTNKTYMKFFTARGCPYPCNFCANDLQMTYRSLSPAKVVEQLTILVTELGVEWIEFMDLTFTISRKRVQELCKEITAAGLAFDWGCETRADLIDEDLLRDMKNAGCKKITFGVEAGSEAIRFSTGKRITNEKIVYAFNLCHRIGIKTMANFIFGHPGENLQDMRESISFAKTLRPFNVVFLRMIPLPDIKIFRDGVEKEGLDVNMWYRYMKGEIGHPVYCPASINAEQMDTIIRRAYIDYYISFRSIMNYLPLFMDFRFFIRSLFVFFKMAAGKPVFK